MTEVQAALSAVVSRLQSAGLQVWLDAAPSGVSGPWLTVSVGGGEDVLTGGEARGYTEIVLAVAAHDDSTSGAAADAAIETADAALHGALTTAGGRAVHLARTGVARYARHDEGRVWQTVSATYRGTVR